MVRVSRWLLAVFLLVGSFAVIAPASAAPFATSEFQTVWEQTDKPVRDFGVSRTWMWGPEANTGAVSEPFEYDLAASGNRTVQYFDKSRMELGVPKGSDFWLVTNGLLAEELITGNLQLGIAKFEQHTPAEIGVTGDPGDPTVPTYATFKPLQAAAPDWIGYHPDARSRWTHWVRCRARWL
ncbi:hypothetical protein [Nitrolancea hollandica]|uniref:Uncharacterized protein n=1 Tax=Nitrolancea hollandica Lb TaxID=1129897 RepID=I4ELK3_9BACT|nr:hypothetical protein [Nitrolancea hollandica]CCF85565.1 conserved exported hypothetical protein [Nitrolancea hollandica Lb]